MDTTRDALFLIHFSYLHSMNVEYGILHNVSYYLITTLHCMGTPVCKFLSSRTPLDSMSDKVPPQRLCPEPMFSYNNGQGSVCLHPLSQRVGIRVCLAFGALF